jgi:hypothetical protein
MLTLTHEEIVEITGKKRPRSQREELRQIGIPFRLRSDGSPIVLRAVVEMELGYAPKETRPASPRLRVPQARQLLLRQKQ